MPNPEKKIVELPQSVMGNMSETAKAQLAEHASQLVTSPPPSTTGDEGVYQNGVLGLGWYHFGTSADQNFIGHDNAPDFYIFDWGVTSDGSFTSNGNDTIDQWEGDLDRFWDTNVSTFQSAGFLGGISYDWVYDAGLPGLDPGSSGKVSYWFSNFDSIVDGKYEKLASAGSMEWLHVV